MAQAMRRAPEAAAEVRRPTRGWVAAFSVLGLLLEQRALGVATVVAPLVHVALVMLGLPSWRCPFHAATGLPCPGCGASRAMASLFRGEWGAVFRSHPFAPLFLLGWVVLAVGIVLPAFRRRGLVRWLDGLEGRTRVVGIVLLAFVGHGVVRLIVVALAASS